MSINSNKSTQNSDFKRADSTLNLRTLKTLYKRMREQTIVSGSIYIEAVEENSVSPDMDVRLAFEGKGRPIGSVSIFE
jgi:hypothetical protein